MQIAFSYDGIQHIETPHKLPRLKNSDLIIYVHLVIVHDSLKEKYGALNVCNFNKKINQEIFQLNN